MHCSRYCRDGVNQIAQRVTVCVLFNREFGNRQRRQTKSLIRVVYIQANPYITRF